MNIFGWDYPPGCNSTPYDEDQVIDLGPYLTKMGATAVGYWTEDGTIHAGQKYDNEGFLPKVADLEWNDDLSEEHNAQVAAEIIAKLFAVDHERQRKLLRRLEQARKRSRERLAQKTVLTFAQWLEDIGAPEGDFCWDNDDPGDAHVYCCGERDCPQQWHQAYYTEEIGRKNGEAYVTIRSGDEDGNWDFDSGYEEGDPPEGWAEVWRIMESRSDDYFSGWANYHLECALTHTDPCGAFLKAEDGASSKKHLDAAEDMIDCLAGVSMRTRRAHRKARKAA